MPRFLQHYPEESIRKGIMKACMRIMIHPILTPMTSNQHNPHPCFCIRTHVLRKPGWHAVQLLGLSPLQEAQVWWQGRHSLGSVGCRITAWSSHVLLTLVELQELSGTRARPTGATMWN